MQQVRVKAKSSSGLPCDVVFTNNGKSFTVFCTCQAGIHGKLCKHKTQLLQGDESMLSNSSDAPALQAVRAWVSSSQYDALLAEHAAIKEEIKKEIEAAKRKEQGYRRSLEEAMRKGVPLLEKT